MLIMSTFSFASLVSTIFNTLLYFQKALTKVHSFSNMFILFKFYQTFSAQCMSLVDKPIPAATRAVNPGFVSLNPISANILSDISQKSTRQASFIFHRRARCLCGKAVSWFKRLVWSMIYELTATTCLQNYWNRC